jgi:hypothetical protein
MAVLAAVLLRVFVALWLVPGPVLAQAPDSATVNSVPATDTLARDTAPQYRIVAAGPVSVTAKLKSHADKLTIGDQFKVELVVRRLRDVQVSQPFAQQVEPFAIADRKSVTRYKGDTIVDTHTLKMAAFATGELKLPPFLVAYPSNGEVLAAASDSIPIKVVSVMVKDMKDINDLKRQVQFPNYLPLWILLGVIAATALGYLGWRLYRRYRRMKLYGAPLPDPWDEALAALDAVPVDAIPSATTTRCRKSSSAT